MIAQLKQIPLSLLFLGFSGIAMYAPVPLAIVEREWATARSFFYSGTILIILVAMLAIATSGRKVRNPVRSQLVTLLAAWAVLPIILAIPLFEGPSGATFFETYFEMVSSLTTTGATVFDANTLNGAEHLWRALVGWLGGFLFWTVAIAILAPLSLGGFEIIGSDPKIASRTTQIGSVMKHRDRFARHVAELFPVCLGLTAVLWLLLVLSGDDSFVALCHAMSVLSTSGISPLAGLDEGGAGIAGEGFMILFMVFALSRRTFERDGLEKRVTTLRRDPELRLGMMIVLVVPLILFMRHWIGAIEVRATGTIWEGFLALWGGFFTVASFLTSTGFESAYWDTAQSWSRLETPGLILLGLAMIGGGVATTAGGVKLLRVFVLYRHAQRELERLVHPHSIGGSGAHARSERRHGAYLAWIFFMLFAFSVAAVMLALSLTGIGFEPAVILTVAAISTTGPLASIAGDIPIFYSTLPDTAKAILMAAMVLGRLETLALIALFNPEFWRG